MAKALYVEEKDLNRMLKIAATSGELPVRNVALLTTIYGTGMMLTEIAPYAPAASRQLAGGRL
ncbi:hypothetical protein BN2497_5793 [Janthinobacterium sp. CG23_2]|nr:hypothetical protein BN2497_5793 [Janthinobacterium sp. CG23_2]CUU29294.1 hypothetical protein BN3177_5793 [Janthinobacterium sp. CG23_2]